MSVLNIKNFRYVIPTFGKNKSIVDAESLMKIQQELYDYAIDFDYMSYDKSLKLMDKLQKEGYKMSFDAFCETFGYSKYKDYAEILSKFMGIGFNSVNFSSEEDTMIRDFFPIFGKYTNVVVYHFMVDEIGVDDYIMKSEREIQDRVDYLQRGKHYFNKEYRDFIPGNLKGILSDKTKALVCIHEPAFRTDYTFAEKRMMHLNKMYPYNFIPWKDLNEVKYLSNVFSKEEKEKYLKMCDRPTFNIKTVIPYFDAVLMMRLGVLLLKKNCMQSYNSRWNSYQDEILKMCLDENSSNLDLNEADSLKALYEPLLAMGKTIKDCEERRKQLGFKVKYSYSEIEAILKNVTDTYDIQSSSKKGIKRSSYSIALQAMNAENIVGSRIPEMTEEMREKYLNMRFGKGRKAETL